MIRHLTIALAAIVLAACVPAGPGGGPLIPGFSCGTASLANPQIDWPESPVGPLPPFNRAAFRNFISTAPSPVQFRNRYPDMTLVMPGDMATMDLRYNYSRFFAETGPRGCITGGRFQ